MSSSWDIGADEAAESCSTDSDEDTARALLGALRAAEEWMGQADLVSFTASLVRDIRAGERLRVTRS